MQEREEGKVLAIRMIGHARRDCRPEEGNTVIFSQTVSHGHVNGGEAADSSGQIQNHPESVNLQILPNSARPCQPFTLAWCCLSVLLTVNWTEE